MAVVNMAVQVSTTSLSRELCLRPSSKIASGDGDRGMLDSAPFINWGGRGQ